MKKLMIIILLNSVSLIVSSDQMQVTDSFFPALKEVLRDRIQHMPNNAVAGACFLTVGLVLGVAVGQGLRYKQMDKHLQEEERRVVEAKESFLSEQKKYCSKLGLYPTSCINREIEKAPTKFPLVLNSIIVQFCADSIDTSEVEKKWLSIINNRSEQLRGHLRDANLFREERDKSGFKPQVASVSTAVLPVMLCGAVSGASVGFVSGSLFNVKNSCLYGGLASAPLLIFNKYLERTYRGDDLG